MQPFRTEHSRSVRRRFLILVAVLTTLCSHPSAIAQNASLFKAPDSVAASAAGIEDVTKRTPSARHFRQSNGVWTAVLGNNLNYDNGTGTLIPVLPELFQTPSGGWELDAGPLTVSVPKSAKGHDVVHAYTGPDGKQHTFTLSFPNLTYTTQTAFTFPLGGLTWNLSLGAHRTEFTAAVRSTRGVQTYSFDYDTKGTSASVNTAGHVVATDGASLLRPMMVRADKQITLCSPWSLNNKTLSVTCDDSSFPETAFPYLIDPAFQAPRTGVAYCGGSAVSQRPSFCNQGGSVEFGISDQLYLDSNNNLNVNNYEQDYAFDTSSVPSGATISSAAIGFTTGQVTFTNGSTCSLRTYSSTASFPTFLGLDTNTPDVVPSLRIDNAWVSNTTYSVNIAASAIVTGGTSR